MLRFALLLLLTTIIIKANGQSFKEPEYVGFERMRAQKKLSGQASLNTGNYDWVYQRLHLQVDPRNTFLSGETAVYFSFNTASNRIVFDLSSGLTVHSVTYHGQPVSFSHNSQDELTVTLPAQVAPGVLDSVHINYSGNPANSGLGSYTIDTHNGVPVLWTLSEPYGAKDWWPCKNDLTDKLDSIDVVLEYPAEINGETMQGVSNGILVNEYMSGSNKISHWRHRHPIPAYLVAIAVTNYVKYTHQAGIYTPFPVDNYVYPEDYSYAASSTPVIVSLMNYFEEKFGEYPYSDEKYGHAQFGWGGGMEHTTVSFMGSFGRGLQAHELAHQWFGDEITCGSWSDIWLNEGFATYAEALTQEHLDGDYAFLQWRIYANNLIIQEPHESVYVYGNDTLDVGRVFSWRLSYLKGAMVLHMLRFRTGDSVFFDILQTYRNLRRNDFARTDDFKAAVEQVTGENYDEFFNDWVYGKGYPFFTARWALLPANTYRVELQQTPSDASVDFFETPVRLRFSSSSHTQTYDTVVNFTQNNQVFIINADNAYDQLQIDPDFEIIRGGTQVMFTGNFDWNGEEIIIFPVPATEYIRVFHKNADEVQHMYIFDSGGRILSDRLSANRIIDIRNLSKGVYFIGFLYRNGTYQAVPFLKN